MRIDIHGLCFQCLEFAIVATFKDVQTHEDNAICENCLNNLIVGKLVFE